MAGASSGLAGGSDRREARGSPVSGQPGQRSPLMALMAHVCSPAGQGPREARVLPWHLWSACWDVGKAFFFLQFNQSRSGPGLTPRGPSPPGSLLCAKSQRGLASSRPESQRGGCDPHAPGGDTRSRG